MRVYRLECQAGHGPWKDGPNWHARELHDNLAEAEGLVSAHEHPSPADDPLLRPFLEDNTDRFRKHVFGFVSKDQFLDWFSHYEGRGHLEQAGMRLNEYGVSPWHVRVGTEQLIFRKDKAVKVEEWSPVDPSGPVNPLTAKKWGHNPARSGPIRISNARLSYSK